MGSPLASFSNLCVYKQKIGGAYKATGTLSLTPTSSITSDYTNGILGSVRWANTDYAAIIQSFGFQLLTSTGFASTAFTGFTVYKVTGYTSMDTGGTDVTSKFSASSLTGMPASRMSQVVLCQNATSAMSAGTRTLGNSVYNTIVMAGTGSSTLQAGAIYQFKWGDDEPLVLLANDGLEYQIPYGLTLPANKNLTVNLITSWIEVPREIIKEYYGI